MLILGADPNISNKDSETALMVAMYQVPSRNLLQMTKLLLKYGVDPRAGGVAGHTALSLITEQKEELLWVYGHSTVIDCYNEVIKLLINARKSSHDMM